MASGFSSVPHPGSGDWDERAFRPSRGNGAPLSRFAMMSTGLLEGKSRTALTTAPKRGGEACVCVCVHGGVETPMFRLQFAIRRGGVREDLGEMGGSGGGGGHEVEFRRKLGL